MKRLVLPLAVLLLACASSPARAQVPIGTRPVSPFVRPPVSPFINLFRGGAAAGVNYYGIVRPQLETQAALQQLQLQGAAAAPYLDGSLLATKGILDTGTPSRFLSYQQY